MLTNLIKIYRKPVLVQDSETKLDIEKMNRSGMLKILEKITYIDKYKIVDSFIPEKILNKRIDIVNWF